MNSIRLRAREVIITSELSKDPGWNPFLRGRTWAGRNGRSWDDRESRHADPQHETVNDGEPLSRRRHDTHSDHSIVPAVTAPPFEVPHEEEEKLPTFHSRPLEPESGEDGRSSLAPKEAQLSGWRKWVTRWQLFLGIPHSSAFAHPSFTVANQFLAIFSSWISILLPFVPAGFVVNYLHLHPNMIFAINFLAIFPLGAIAGVAMDEVMLRAGDNVGVLIYMTFGNITQLVTSILLLKTRQIAILKTSLIGGILSGVLLITGASYVAGSLPTHRKDQYFNSTMAQTIVNFLALSVASLIMPTASHIFAHSTPEKIAAQSRGTAIVMLLAYGFYLYLQLKTHRDFFGLKDDNAYASKKVKKYKQRVEEAMHPQSHFDPDPEEEEELITILLHPSVALLTLILSTTLLGFNTSFAVDTLTSLTTSSLSPSFVGLILLPLLSLDLLPVKCAQLDKLDLTIMASAGKALQTSLLITPLIVVIGWIMGVEEMSLLFDEFQVVSVFVAVLLFGFQIGDGKSNYLDGVLLLAIYIIIAIAAWYD